MMMMMMMIEVIKVKVEVSRNGPLTVPLPRIAGSAGMVCHCAVTVSSNSLQGELLRVIETGKDRGTNWKRTLETETEKLEVQRRVVWRGLSAVCVGRGIKGKKLTSTPQCPSVRVRRTDNGWGSICRQKFISPRYDLDL